MLPPFPDAVDVPVLTPPSAKIVPFIVTACAAINKTPPLPQVPAPQLAPLRLITLPASIIRFPVRLIVNIIPVLLTNCPLALIITLFALKILSVLFT